MPALCRNRPCRKSRKFTALRRLFAITITTTPFSGRRAGSAQVAAENDIQPHGLCYKRAVDFLDRERHARRQSRLLAWLFGAAVLAAMAINCLVLGACILPMLEPRPYGFHLLIYVISVAANFIGALFHPLQFLQRLGNDHLAGWITLGTLTSITLGCLYKARLLARGGPAVAELLGGRLVKPDSSNPDEKRLCDVIEEMAIASSMPVPEVYVLDRERGINTFAAGHTRDDVAIGVTFGCTKLLTRDELQGVIAHEFSHVLNGDTRLNLKLMALAHGLFWPTIVGRVLLRGSTEAPEMGESIFDEPEFQKYYPLLPLALLFMLIGSATLPLVRLIKGSICRQREWLADAAAVQFTRNPAGIEGALKKIGGLLKQSRLDTPYAETASHLYFASSTFDPWFIFLSTHPPVAKRILALDSGFDGQFPHIRSLPVNSLDTQYDRIYEETLLRARAEARAHPDGDA
jgi:Zn-dependent protease with chaperone function